jgi:hypothetical protein
MNKNSPWLTTFCKVQQVKSAVRSGHGVGTVEADIPAFTQAGNIAKLAGQRQAGQCAGLAPGSRNGVPACKA